MKKLFTLVMMALLAVGGANAANLDLGAPTGGTTDDDGNVYFDAEANLITFHAAWNWRPSWWLAWDNETQDNTGLDISAYDYFVLKLSGATADVQAIVEYMDGTNSSASGKRLIKVSLDNTKKIKQIYLQCGTKDATATFVSAALTEIKEYQTTGTEISFDENGNILASAFEGFTDDAKVEITIEATGEATNASGNSVLGWGIGSIKSLDGSVELASLGLQKIGDNVYTYTVGDLKDALEAPADQYDRQGININVWSQGNATCTRKSVIVYEVKSDAPAFDVYTVAGSKVFLNGDTDWAETNADNDMTTEDGVTYKFVKEGVTLEAGVTYEFKVVKDHAWATQYPSSNYGFTVDETAVYTVTITFVNDDDHTISVDTEKTGTAGPVEHAYSVMGTIKGNWDVDTDMTKNADGLYEAVFTDVAAGSYAFKVRVDHSWGVAYPSSNYTFTVETDGSTVTITFNEETKEVNASVAGPGTGIKAITEANGSAVRYNLAGQKVDAQYKGVVIVNGRKMMQK